MRTKFYLAALAAVAMASCSQNEILETQGGAPKAIEFGLYTGKAVETRGTETTITTIETNGFGVTATYTGQEKWSGLTPVKAPDFMWNEKVYKSGGSWTYSPLKYWPTMKNDMISFFAHAPYVEGNGDDANPKLSVNTATGAPTLTVKIADKVEDMIDFVADAVYDATHDKAEPSAVAFTMKHEMTRLSVSATLDNALEANKSTVVIKSITLEEAPAQGESKNTAIYHSEGTYKFPTSNETTAVGSWDFTGNTATTFELEDFLDFNTATVHGKSYESPVYQLTTTEVKDLVPAAADAAAIGDDETDPNKQYLFFLPPNGTSGLTNQMVITIKYDIVTEDKKLKDQYSCTEATKIIYLSKGQLAQGVAYDFKLTFEVDDVEFSASVSPWIPDTQDNITVPYDPDTTPVTGGDTSEEDPGT